MGIFKKLKNEYITKDSKTYIKYLRRKGITIGEHCIFREPKSATIDKTRPALISIGNYVDMNRNFTIMTHDYVTSVFIRKFGDFINSSGKVVIGNNIYFGVNCTVLKGATIGDNCVIGAHSLVTGTIPPNSVATGVPARVVCTIEEYYEKRKNKAVEEAFEYARAIQSVNGRRPVLKDFTEEFIYFVDKRNLSLYKDAPIKHQLQEAYASWLEHHKARFESLDEFLAAAGLE